MYVGQKIMDEAGIQEASETHRMGMAVALDNLDNWRFDYFKQGWKRPMFTRAECDEINGVPSLEEACEILRGIEERTDAVGSQVAEDRELLPPATKLTPGC